MSHIFGQRKSANNSGGTARKQRHNSGANRLPIPRVWQPLPAGSAWSSIKWCAFGWMSRTEREQHFGYATLLPTSPAAITAAVAECARSALQLDIDEHEFERGFGFTTSCSTPASRK